MEQTIGTALNKEVSRISTVQTIVKLSEIEQVELTAEESDKALYDAKAIKYFKIKEQTERERKIEILKNASKPFSTVEMYNYAMQVAGKDYLLDEFTLPVFKLLSQYFTNDPGFEMNGYSLQKGILIMGLVGVGKTDLLKAFRYNKKCSFIVESCKEAERRIHEHGIQYWQTYTGYVPGHGGTEKYFFQKNVGWMLDDLGREEVIKDYGNTLDAMDSIIHQRYLLKDKIPFYSLHLTTNLNAEALETRYGQRFRSRLREMFNLIELKGTDRRK